jgi:hypothetical protein
MDKAAERRRRASFAVLYVTFTTTIALTLLLVLGLL